MIVLLLVLKLLVSSHPLNFKGVLAFMFCFIIKDKLSTTLLCFYYALDNHFTFPCTLYIVFCLFYFSCYSMVTKFYCNIISTMSMLSYYDPSSMCFYILFDQECVTACHLKNYCLLSLTYSGRAGVKLGDVDTSQTYL